MNLKSRIEKLKGQQSQSTGYGKGSSRRDLEVLFHHFENAQRESKGLEPLPDLKYTQEDYESDLKLLEEGIPRLGASRGWQSEEGREMLKQWEVDTREDIARYEA